MTSPSNRGITNGDNNRNKAYFINNRHKDSNKLNERSKGTIFKEKGIEIKLSQAKPDPFSVHKKVKELRRN